ncbi:DsbA family protein [Corynebacterium gerontici]|uniref:DsbA family protein n=1 Tax=Corynebacterium gerontici TaxID=2079234 RepID=UPI000F4F3D50|nr:thioredoxin domain-containing protein [Corynebacterium gerontici]
MNNKKSKIQNPNEQSKSFIWALVVLVVVVVAVVGFIVMQGKEKKDNAFADHPVNDVAFSAAVEDNSITLKSDKAGKDAKVVDIYEDYSCPHCGDLAKETDEKTRELLDQGKVIVKIHDLNFLDDKDGTDNEPAKDGNSTLAGASALAIAKDGDAKTYWAYRDLLYTEQANIYNKWKAEDFANAAKQLGASDDAVAKIKDYAYQDELVQHAEANAQELEDKLGKVSSPQVFIDGKHVEGNPAEWVNQI